MSSSLEAGPIPLGGGAPGPRHAARTPRTLVIAPPRSWPRIDLRELWEYRGLFVFLVRREIKVRYAQTLLGAGWAVLQPLLTMAVFAVIFGRFARIPSDGVPYPVFSLAALVPWTYFATALTGASLSLTADRTLITKIYFPRLVIPIAPVLSGLLDFAIGMVMLVALMAVYGIVPQAAALLLLPVAVLSMVLCAAGVGSWLAALNIQYRDVRYVIPFLTQVWMFASPIVYPTSLVPERYRAVYALNPMVGVIEGLRASLLGTAAVDLAVMGVSLASSAVLFVAGMLYFRRTERHFADVA